MLKNTSIINNYLTLKKKCKHNKYLTLPRYFNISHKNIIN